MKRLALLPLFLVTVLFFGCSGSSDPAKIAEKFAKAYYKGDYDTCNSLLEKEKFTPSKDMSESEKESMKELKKYANEMKFIITPNKEDDELGEDYFETTFIITSKKESALRDKFIVYLEKDEDNKWLVKSFKIK